MHPFDESHSRHCPECERPCCGTIGGSPCRNDPGCACSCHAAPMLRPGTCQHPTITDAALIERQSLIARSWGAYRYLTCPDCGERLYPHDDGETTTVYAGEPYGAGADPAGRPSPVTNPEYWTE